LQAGIVAAYKLQESEVAEANIRIYAIGDLVKLADRMCAVDLSNVCDCFAI
jgi:hypothetical protein